MKKIMILGAGYSQVPLIKAAKRLGLYTIVSSTPGDWPGFAEADESVYADISDPQAVLEAAQRLQIDGITTCCLDTGVAAIGYVCEKMNLPGPTAQAARIASNKYAMKEAFYKGDVQCARHVCIKNEAELEQALQVLQFPLIVKAVDLMGSRGIFRCNTKEEVFENYKKTMEATRQDYCLIEEFIEGTLFGTEAMIRNGEFVYCLPDNTEAFQSYVPTPIGHSIPFEREADLGQQVREQVKKAISAVGLDNCPVNCDMIYKDQKVYVIEITGRAGATCLPELIGIYYGIDYYEAIVRLAMDMNVTALFDETKKHSACLAHVLSSDRTGIIKEIKNNNSSGDYIEDLSFNIEPGELVRKYENGRDRIGQVIVKGDTLEDCRMRLEQVLSGIELIFES